MEERRVLVTGAAGFIGRALVLDLVGRGYAVVGLDVRPRPGWWPPEAAYVPGDIRDARAVARAMAGCRAVCHLAAEAGIARSLADPQQTAAVNVMGTVVLLDAARHAGVEAFAFASSCATLARARGALLSPYAASKLSAEAYCQAFAESYGLHAAVLRLSNVYGPGSAHKASAVAAMLKSGLGRRRIQVTGDGRQERDFVYVEDVAQAFVRAIERRLTGTYVIATGQARTILEVARSVAQLLGLGEEALEFAPPVRGEARTVNLDPRPAREALGWEAHTRFEVGLRRTLDWFLAHPEEWAVS